MKFAVLGKENQYNNQKYLVVILNKVRSNNSRLYNCRILKPEKAAGEIIQCEFENYDTIKDIEDDPDALLQTLLYYELGD